MNQVLSKLEKALDLQHKHDHLEAVAVEGTPSNHLKVTLQDRGLDHLRFKLSDIDIKLSKSWQGQPPYIT
ncbi:hypothetical protein L1987_86942 [Smallanthus sonchifolius]|uniref:Uncharacterized protein n=1 Tax=Smallanthus sonchifolius TaxID=185202 RepID=A0ACB8Y1G9_9ASTR|nr:hypothetical protein L1987_86942 [Smallanthus sonchifolius]